MFSYFGYGSNMNLTSLRAKGVEPESSITGTLKGYRLVFNVRHWFPHEGGVGNIVTSAAPHARVEGVVHTCRDEHLARLDAVESYGSGYDRVEVDVETADGIVRATTYVGLPEFLDDACLPTSRYLNIVVRGAEQSGLSPEYVTELRDHPLFRVPEYPPFKAPLGAPTTTFGPDLLRSHPHHTALAGHVFDMSSSPQRLRSLLPLFGGRDMTVFHVRRLDTSDGSETEEDVRAGRLSPQAESYLNAYLHNYALVFRYAGRYDSSL